MSAVLCVQMAHKLSRLALTGCSTLVLTAEEVLFEDELQVLRDALPHVKTLHTLGMELQLEYFTITPAFAAELAELQAAGWDKLSLGEVQWHTDVPAPPLVSPLPPLHSLNLGDNLEDTLLRDLGRWCPVLRKLDVQLMGLSGPLPEGCVVPWEVVGVGFGTSVRDWLQQSEWLGKDIEWELGTLKLSLTAEEVRWPCTHTDTHTIQTHIHTHTHAERTQRHIMDCSHVPTRLRTCTRTHAHTLSLVCFTDRSPMVITNQH